MPLRKGQVLFDGPDPSDAIQGIINGAPGVTLPQPRGGSLLVHVLRPGWWFGEDDWAPNGRRRIGVDASTVLRVSATEVRVMMGDRPELRPYVTRLACVNRRIAFAAVGDLMIRRGESRIAAVLPRVTGARDASFLAPENDGTVWVQPTEPLALTQSQLALMANASRDLINRRLARSEAAGWVEPGYNRIAIRQPDALAAFAYGFEQETDPVDA